MSASPERHEFATEVQDLLNIMVNSLYSNKEIFLRELVSNASDALDKLHVEGLTHKELLPEEELTIRVEVDPNERTLSVIDNGIGMSEAEVIRDIGTIARSGTKAFLKALEQRKAQEGDDASGAADPDLIGQFGVGFYSSFMVAEHVTVLTRRAGTDTATRWESSLDGGYTVQEASRPSAGTTVTLKLKPADEEDGLSDFTDSFALRRMVKKHSDFVAYPIKMMTERQEPVLDDEGKPVEGAVPKLIKEDQTLNSMKAIWTRPRSEVSDEEYQEFYRHISHDWGEPLDTILAHMEGAFEARALLFVPKKAPFDLYYRDRVNKGLQLYVKRVFIMDDCEELVPEWLRFVRGVVDSEDLSLNVSREILQQNRQIRALSKFLIKKVLDALSSMRKERGEDYKAFWTEFGPVLKEGLTGAADSRDRILDVLLADTTHDDGTTSLAEYIERMQEGQEVIYFITGTSLEAAKRSPHLEAFADKNLEVLFFTDTVDEFWLQGELEYQGKKLVSVSKGEVDLKADDNKEDDKADDSSYFADLLGALRAHLQDDIKEVRLSKRLTQSAACLVGETADLSPQLEEMMRRMGQEMPKTKRILEVNGDHPLMGQLRALHAADPKAPDLEHFAKLLYGQAILAEGGTLENPAAYGKLVMEMMVRASGADAGA